MNGAHLHLLVNHVPVLGPYFALALVAWCAARRSEVQAMMPAAIVLTLSTVGAAVALLTGEYAEEAVEHVPGVTHQAIEAHELWAGAATCVLGLTAVLALAVFSAARKRGAFRRGALVAVAIATAISAAAMSGIGLAGGRIRHAEEIGQSEGSGVP